MLCSVDSELRIWELDQTGFQEYLISNVLVVLFKNNYNRNTLPVRSALSRVLAGVRFSLLNARMSQPF